MKLHMIYRDIPEVGGLCRLWDLAEDGRIGDVADTDLCLLLWERMWHKDQCGLLAFQSFEVDFASFSTICGR